MKTTPVKFLFIAVFVYSASTFAETDLPNESLNEDFLEFLADLENINDVWLHPVDFKNSNTDNSKMKTNKTTASEVNNE